MYASYMYPESARTRFIVAVSVNCVLSFIGILFAMVLRFVLGGLNKKVDSYVPFAVLGVPFGFCIDKMLLGAEKPGLRLLLGV